MKHRHKAILIFILTFTNSLFGQTNEAVYNQMNKETLIQVYLLKAKRAQEIDSLQAIENKNQSISSSLLSENKRLQDSLARIRNYIDSMELVSNDLKRLIEEKDTSKFEKVSHYLNEINTLIKINKDQNIKLAEIKNDLSGKTWKLCPSIEQFDLDWAVNPWDHDNEKYIHSIKFLDKEICEVYCRDTKTLDIDERNWNWSFDNRAEKPKTGFYKLVQLDEEHYILQLRAVFGIEGINSVAFETDESKIYLKTTKDGIIFFQNNLFGRLKK